MPTVPILLAITYDDTKDDHPATWPWNDPSTFDSSIFTAAPVPEAAPLFHVDDDGETTQILSPSLIGPFATHTRCPAQDCNTMVPLARLVTATAITRGGGRRYGLPLCSEHAEKATDEYAAACRGVEFP